MFPEKFTLKLLGRTVIADALMTLNKLTLEEARMAMALLMKTQTVEDSVRRVMDMIIGVDSTAASVDDSVEAVNDNAGRTDIEDALKLDKPMQEEARMATVHTHTVGNRVRRVMDRVLGIDNRVAGVGVDDKGHEARKLK